MEDFLRAKGFLIRIDSPGIFRSLSYYVPGKCESRGGEGGQDPLKNHKNIGFLSNSGPDSLENHKATKPSFNNGPPSTRQRYVI